MSDHLSSAHAPTIELDGARLRPLRAADADALLAYLSEPIVTELTSYPPVTAALVNGMIERSASRWAAGEPSRWGVARADDDRLIGTCGFNDASPPHRWAEIAYDLAPAHWGHGLMRRAVQAALDWGFGGGHVDRVQAYVRADNLRSQTLLERSGFVREGRLREFRICRGQRYDFYLYGLLRAEWAVARQPSR